MPNKPRPQAAKQADARMLVKLYRSRAQRAAREGDDAEERRFREIAERFERELKKPATQPRRVK
jgi:hypothetical protein